VSKIEIPGTTAEAAEHLRNLMDAVNGEADWQADIEWAMQVIELLTEAPEGSQRRPERQKTPASAHPANGAVRPRGRPRKDGLVPGSPEAKAADAAKRRKPKSEGATITPLPTPEPEPAPRRRLVRVGS